MNETHYLFALYVFLLVCGVIWFYSRTVGKARSAKDKKGYDREQKLFTLYQEIEDMLKGFELYVEEAKAEIENHIRQMEQQTRTQPEQYLQPEQDFPPQPQEHRIDPWASVMEHAMSQTVEEDDRTEPVQKDEADAFFLAPSNPLEDVIVELSQRRAAEAKRTEPEEQAFLEAFMPQSDDDPLREADLEPRIAKPYRQRRRVVRESAPADVRSTKEIVLEYAEKGMDQKEIARLLGISSREVALILELKKIAQPEMES